LGLRLPYRTAYHADQHLERVGAVFVRIETRQGEVAWGCAAFEPAITGETLQGVTQTCRACGRWCARPFSIGARPCAPP